LEGKKKRGRGEQGWGYMEEVEAVLSRRGPLTPCSFLLVVV
jgi:hypothetical protein